MTVQELISIISLCLAVYNLGYKHGKRDSEQKK